MTQLITRLSWNDPWSTPHHLAAKCVPPYLLLSSCCFHKQQLTFMHGTTHFILRLLNEDKHGASIVYRKWEPLTSTLEEDYDRKCTGHRSHISLLATLTHSTRLFANSLLFEEGGAPLFTPTFLFLDGRGTFSCDDVDGILCCVICCILNDGWLLAISLAWLLVVIVSKLQQQQQTEQFFRVVETPQREIEKQQDLPGRITILISWMPLPLEF